MKTTYPNSSPDDEDDLASEYAFDYNKAKPNRFAAQESISNRIIITNSQTDVEAQTRVVLE